MLRLTAILLVLANLLYWGWTQRLLAPLGLAPTEQREPERVQNQIRPEALRLLNAPREPARPAETKTEPASLASPTETPPNKPSSAETPATSPQAPVVSTAEAPKAPEPAAPQVENTVCWRASGFTPEQADRLRTVLENSRTLLGEWQMAELKTGGRWIVYMGKFSGEVMLRKKSELRALKVEFRETSAPGLVPGLALGTYSSEASAEQALADLQRKGVRTARVAQERAEGSVFAVRFPSLNSEQRAAVNALGTALAGRRMISCD